MFVDDVEEPKIFYVKHLYGMSLLFGGADNECFNRKYLDYCLNRNNSRSAFEWMQAYPNDWYESLSDLFGDKLVDASSNGDARNEFIELNGRVNFKFNQEKYLDFKKADIRNIHEIKRTNIESFSGMKVSVIPSLFWNSAQDFCNMGIGFSLYYQNTLATTAYSAFIFDNELELEIETIPQYRGRGFAQYTCSALIDYCLQNGYEPIWSCKLTNTASYNLAQKLGFVPVRTVPFLSLGIVMVMFLHLWLL